MSEWIEIDGAEGEGGGQILRTSLALAAITGRSVHFVRIRAGRKKPGLRRQHLTAVRAAARVSSAMVRGDEVGSMELWFQPGPVVAGHHRFAVGTAGSTTLVLQTVLWPLVLAQGASHVVVEGGTHNPMAPTFDYLAHTFVPAVAKMGARIELTLDRHGFFPKGGGRIVARIEGAATLRPIEILDRGPRRAVRGRACVARLPVSIARREIDVVHERLKWSPADLQAEVVESDGPGNVVLLSTTHASGTTVCAAIGQKGKPAEHVAAEACDDVARFEAAGVPVDEHLADQLLVGMALARGGVFRTMRPTLHTRTNAAVIERFLSVTTRLVDEGEGTWRVEMVGDDPAR